MRLPYNDGSILFHNHERSVLSNGNEQFENRLVHLYVLSWHSVERRLVRNGKV